MEEHNEMLYGRLLDENDLTEAYRSLYEPRDSPPFGCWKTYWRDGWLFQDSYDDKYAPFQKGIYDRPVYEYSLLTPKGVDKKKVEENIQDTINQINQVFQSMN